MKRNTPLLAVTIVVVIYLYLPIAILILFSFNSTHYIAFPIRELTLKWYGDMLANTQLLSTVLNSFKVGLVASVVSTLIATLAAKAANQFLFPGKPLLIGLISLPLVMPEVILGLAMLIVLIQAFGLSLSLVTVTLGHIVVCTPFALAIMMSRFAGYDPSYDEASRDLGENAFVTFFRVTLPIVWPGIVSSLLLTFLISFDDFVVSFFLTGTDQTLPIFIWGQLRFPQKLPQVLAIGVLVLAVSTILVIIAELLRRRGEKAGVA